ncbi:MAG: c-type cytochrome [Planctomycetota bacterium]
MTPRWQISSQVVAALAASASLVGVLVWEHNKNTSTQWSTFLVGDPSEGAKLFFERKGCVRCHSVNGWGGKSAPDLGFAPSPQSDLTQIVSALWNHAPRMWERMRAEKVPYPDLNHKEVANLFAFLYTARYVDEPGDERRGERLFEAKACTRCHAVRGIGGSIGPDLSAVVGVDTPIVWTQAMWNHAPAMEARMRQVGVSWPRFEGREMNDLLAYVREVCRGPRREWALLPASPERGWKVFQNKSCIVCHSVKGKGGRIGPELGPGRQLPLSIVQFAGVMWNHSSEMWRAPEVRNVARPTFDERQIADLVAFLSSLRYFEPAGSPRVGETLFAERGCSGCHGPRAEGSRLAPALRVPGRSFTAVTLATAFWGHGPNMYRRTQELRVPWPTLADSDVGNLVSFLNTPIDGEP